MCVRECMWCEESHTCRMKIEERRITGGGKKRTTNIMKKKTTTTTAAQAHSLTSNMVLFLGNEQQTFGVCGSWSAPNLSAATHRIQANEHICMRTYEEAIMIINWMLIWMRTMCVCVCVWAVPVRFPVLRRSPMQNGEIYSANGSGATNASI